MKVDPVTTVKRQQVEHDPSQQECHVTTEMVVDFSKFPADSEEREIVQQSLGKPEIRQRLLQAQRRKFQGKIDRNQFPVVKPGFIYREISRFPGTDMKPLRLEHRMLNTSLSGIDVTGIGQGDHRVEAQCKELERLNEGVQAQLPISLDESTVVVGSYVLYLKPYRQCVSVTKTALYMDLLATAMLRETPGMTRSEARDYLTSPEAEVRIKRGLQVELRDFLENKPFPYPRTGFALQAIYEFPETDFAPLIVTHAY